MRRKKKEGVGPPYYLVLLPPFLHVVLDEFFSVRFEHVVDFIDQLIDIFFQLLAGFDDLRIGLDLFLPLRLSPGLLLAFLFLHPSTSRDSGKLSWISHQRDPYDHLTPRFFQPSSQGSNHESFFMQHISQENSSDQHPRDTKDERREPRVSLSDNQRDDQERHNVDD